MIHNMRERRPPRKGPYVQPSLINRITRMNNEGIKETIQQYGGSSIIIPAMIGHTIALHNGRDFVPVTIKEGMVGYALRDFVPRYTFKSHPKASQATKFK